MTVVTFSINSENLYNSYDLERISSIPEDKLLLSLKQQECQVDKQEPG